MESRGCECAYRVRSCDRSMSVVAGARISILCSAIGSLRLRPITPASSQRDLAGRSIGRSVGSLELTLNLYVFLHTFRYRHDILLTTPRFEDLIYASRWPLTCASCVRLSRTTVYSRRETASTSLTVTAILDPVEHASSTFLSRLPDSRRVYSKS